MIDEQRIIELEIKLTRQEDLAQELSLAVYRQQKQIDDMRAWLAKQPKYTRTPALRRRQQAKDAD